MTIQETINKNVAKIGELADFRFRDERQRREIEYMIKEASVTLLASVVEYINDRKEANRDIKPFESRDAIINELEDISYTISQLYSVYEK